MINFTGYIGNTGKHRSNDEMTKEKSEEELSFFVSILKKHKLEERTNYNTFPYTNKRNGITSYFGNFEGYSCVFMFDVETNSIFDLFLKDIIKNTGFDFLDKKEAYINYMKEWVNCPRRYPSFKKIELFESLKNELDIVFSDDDIKKLINLTPELEQKIRDNK